MRTLITLFGLGVVAVFMAAILTGRRKPPSPPIRGAALLFAALLCDGCATNGVKQDNFPAGVPCVQARADAVNWYRATRHQEPTIRPTRVIVTPDPPDGYGGVTSGSGGGFLIRIWKDQNPFYGSLAHEFRHTMPGCLSEEAVR
jgi:hypothetical protein